MDIHVETLWISVEKYVYKEGKIMNVKLEFPCECHFRIITENLENMYFTIETVMICLGINSPLKKLNTSGKGKYLSFGFTVVVDSKETMNKIDMELRNILGVKMVM